MGAIPEKQTKDKELHNYPFDAEIFRRTFNGYVRKLNIIFSTLVLIICCPIVARAVASYLDMTGIDITGFLRVWHSGASFLSDLGFGYINELISSGIVSRGVISMGGIASCGVISIGGGVSCGVISIGGVGSCGVISIGGHFAVGLISLSSANAHGFVAISTGYKQFIGSDQYTNGKAVGFIAIGRHARGGYALSYDDGGESTYLLSLTRQDPGTVTLFTGWSGGKSAYLLSPERQDPEAVVLFTRLFRKFKGAFVYNPQP